MIPVKVLAVQYLANASPALCRELGVPKGYPSGDAYHGLR